MKRSMAPTMLVSAPSAGGSKSAIARCAAIKFRRMRCASVASSLGVAISSMQRTELTCQDSCSKQELLGILTVCSWLLSCYHLSNDHDERPKVRKNFLSYNEYCSC